MTLLGLGIAAGPGCLDASREHNHPESVSPDVWVHEPASLVVEIPEGWTQLDHHSEGLWLGNNTVPNHRLNIQRLTNDLGRSPLRLMKKAFNEHSDFTEFTIEKSWAEPLAGMFAPAYIATYRYLDVPCVRYGRLLATELGYYEISYHAPGQAHPDAVLAFESLLHSISIISFD